jgi:hypothetical protein
MSRHWTLIWLCLLSLALPLQGVAAATMRHCAPSHERMHGALQPPVPHGEHGSVHQHGRERLADPGPAQAGHAGAAAADTRSELAPYQCSACGACCAAAVLPSKVPDLATVAPAALPAAERGQPQVTYLTDGPERPPPTILA